MAWDKIVYITLSLLNFLGIRLVSKFLEKWLKRHGWSILWVLNTKINLDRNTGWYVTLIDVEARFSIISWQPWAWKSFYLKSFFENEQAIENFVFRWSEFNVPSVNDLFQSYWWFSFWDFEKIIKGKKKLVYIAIDSAEQLLDIRDTAALCEFLSWILSLNTKVVLTCREQYITNINSLLGALGYWFGTEDVITIDALSEEEASKVLSENGLEKPEDVNLFNLLKTPFYLGLFVESWTGKDVLYSDFRERILDYKLGSHIEIRRSFERLVLERVENLNYYLKWDEVDKESINFLKEKWILAHDKDRGYFITYDIYEEWGLLKFIERKYEEAWSIGDFFKALWRQLPMRRAFRIWMKDKLFLSRESVKDILEKTLTNSNVEIYWRDEVIISTLFSQHGRAFLDFWKKELLKDDATLLNKVLLLVRVAGKVPDKTILGQVFTKSESWENATVFLRAEWLAWDNVIGFLFDNRSEICLSRNLLTLLKEYTSSNKTRDTAKKTWLISVHYLTKIENGRVGHWAVISRHNEPVKILSSCILAVSGEIKHEIEGLLDVYLKFNPRPKEYSSKGIWEPRTRCDYLSQKPYFTLVQLLLTSYQDCFESVSHIANKILEIFEYSIYCKDLNWDHWWYEIWPYFWINEKYDFWYHPASSYQTPFYWLLLTNEERIIDFILEFNNKATKKYIASGLDWDLKEIVLHIDWCEYRQYASERLYSLFRGAVPAPEVLSSMHMWLEKYLLEFWKKASKEELTEVSKKLLKNSISVSTTAVVVSLATAFPDKLQDILAILLQTREIFLYDLNRYVRDLRIRSLYWIWKWLDFRKDIFHNERLNTCKEGHRNLKFEDVIRFLQWSNEDTEICKSVHEIFDRHFMEAWEDEDYKFVLNRTDIRKLDIVIQNVDNNQNLVSFNPKNQEIIKQSNASLEEINNNSKYLRILNYSNSKLVNQTVTDDKYADFSDALLELKQFLSDETLKEDSYLYKNLPINIAYIWIRDYSNLLKGKDLVLLQDIILDYGDEILSLYQKRGTTPRIWDEVVFYWLVLLFQKDKGNPRLRRLILEILVSTDYCYISENIFANKLGCLPRNIFSIIKESDASFFESLLWGFIFFRNQRTSREHEVDKINDEYVFNLSTNLVITDYEKHVDELVRWDFFTYKDDVFDSLNDIEDYLLVYWFQLIEDWDLEYLDYVLALSNKIFSTSFNRGDRSDFSILSDFLDKFSRYLLKLEKKSDIDVLLAPFLSHVNLATDTAKNFLSALLFKQDQLGDETYEKFWYIWKDKFFNKFIELAKQNTFYYERDFLVHYLFSWQYWSNNAKSWHTLKNGDDLFFSEVIREIWDNRFVLYSIARLLDWVWTNTYFDQGIDWIYGIIDKSEADIFASFSDDEGVYKSNLIYYLESYMRRYLFIRNQKVRHDKKIKGKVLTILDSMVEHGSSVAYLLRDNI